VFGEDLDMVRDKVAAAVRNEITPVLCVGETKNERDDGETKQVLHDQLMTALSNLTAKEVRDVVIAYEPVWAIGSGDIAKPDQVGEAVGYIRKYVEDVFGDRASKGIRVLYGGSVIPDVVSAFLDIQGMDGFLVGGASLNYHSFSDIVENTRRWQRNKDEARG
jgi:triosephosphate isomerase